ncbi:putative mitochondrial protein [Symbiodinium microadriaticum]|uniref:Putative mitochondrial protein n=1 Tax=Symbiodinium microadriaticum TaxID=2951 RepID=A0A1Q9EU47_SYMMI|nr:putative mitochondrial protein [Symbiodinium microadriaticum]
MWLLRCSETFELLAVLSIYVDDLLLSGTTEASEAIWTAIKAKWRISEPEYADLGKSVTFCGFEIQQKSDGLHVGQSKYIQSFLDKYPEIQGTTTCPYAKENEIIETKPNASLEKLRRAQALVGEMLWLATRTRVDLSFGVSRIGQLITKDVDQAIQRGEDMIRYLRSTKTQEIVYGSSGKGHGPGEQLPEQRDFNLVEVFADASFCPGTDRSQSGIIMLWGNAPVGWMSMRQPCASLSTAEAELQASLDGMTLAEGLYGLLEELAEATQKAFLYNDNVGACTVLTLPQGDDTSRRKQVRGAGSSGAEDWRDLAERPSGSEAAANADGDVQEDADAELQTAMFARQASTYRPVIYPGWHFSAPPSAAWDPEPAWGGPEGNFHQRIPPRIRQDFWFHDLRRRVVIRFHAKPRRKMFLPGPAGWPDGVEQHQLTGRRRTLAKLQSPEGHEILEDDWTTAEKPTKMMARQWTGRTEFELR